MPASRPTSTPASRSFCAGGSAFHHATTIRPTACSRAVVIALTRGAKTFCAGSMRMIVAQSCHESFSVASLRHACRSTLAVFAGS